MTILISGGCKNGKSSLAQDLACDGAKIAGSTPVYFATMIPHDGEDFARIEKHRTDRKNLGFETIECGKNIAQRAGECKNRVVLFDSLTALVANELFDSDSSDSESSESESESSCPNEIPLGTESSARSESDFFTALESKSARITQKIKSDLASLIESTESVIFVSDSIFSDGRIYDQATELYRRILAETENFVATRSDKVYEMTAGKIMHNSQCTMHNGDNSTVRAKNCKLGIINCALIIGGRYQGKLAWAKREFALSDDDICVCTENEMPDFSKKCVAYIEKYISFCLKNEIPIRTDFLDAANEGKIIIATDIFCGVVPIDPFERKWREETGLFLQKIAKKARLYRIFCGKATEI